MYYIGPVIDGFVGAMADLDVDAQVIEDVKQALQTGAAELDRSDFGRIRLPESVFGGSERGAELGHHHSLAHQVVAETIGGVIEDLRSFRSGVTRAVNLVEEADGAAAADLNRRAAACALLVDATRHSEGDERNRAARNEVLAAEATQGSEA